MLKILNSVIGSKLICKLVVEVGNKLVNFVFGVKFYERKKVMLVLLVL